MKKFFVYTANGRMIPFTSWSSCQLVGMRFTKIEDLEITAGEYFSEAFQLWLKERVITRMMPGATIDIRIVWP